MSRNNTSVSVYFDQPLLEELDAVAEEFKRSRSQTLRLLLEEALAFRRGTKGETQSDPESTKVPETRAVA
jgi:metal-responsive CopG/Arc/MetJ family transcriptional regulator